jgi:hypothetical protein
VDIEKWAVYVYNVWDVNVSVISFCGIALAAVGCKLVEAILIEFCYGIFGVLRGTWSYLRSLLISAIDFYYVINKLIILVLNPH